MSNEELYEKLVDKMHDALEEVIINIREDNKKEFDIVNKKINELNGNVKELINVLNQLV